MGTAAAKCEDPPGAPQKNVPVGCDAKFRTSLTQRGAKSASYYEVEEVAGLTLVFSLLSLFSLSPLVSLPSVLLSPLSPLRLLTQGMSVASHHVHPSGGVVSSVGVVPAIYNSIFLFQATKLLRPQA